MFLNWKKGTWNGEIRQLSGVAPVSLAIRHGRWRWLWRVEHNSLMPIWWNVVCWWNKARSVVWRRLCEIVSRMKMKSWGLSWEDVQSGNKRRRITKGGDRLTLGSAGGKWLLKRTRVDNVAVKWCTETGLLQLFVLCCLVYCWALCGCVYVSWCLVVMLWIFWWSYDDCVACWHSSVCEKWCRQSVITVWHCWCLLLLLNHLSLSLSVCLSLSHSLTLSFSIYHCFLHQTPWPHLIQSELK